MNLNHIALTVSDSKEVHDFYQNILGIDKIQYFILEKDFAKTIFGINKEIRAFFLEKDNICFEIFVSSKQIKHGFNHICISTEDRGKMIDKAINNGYEVIQIKKQPTDLVFIKDKTGNMFEIKGQ